MGSRWQMEKKHDPYYKKLKKKIIVQEHHIKSNS